MTEPSYKICFKTTGLVEPYGNIPWLKEAMENELMRCYNIYANMTNGGITEQLNNEFDRRHPEYFKKNRDKEWHELTLYNSFMARGYNSMVCDKMNQEKISELLEFYVDPAEVNFMGRLKLDRSVTIEFFLQVIN